jgi:hypothetical protein
MSIAMPVNHQLFECPRWHHKGTKDTPVESVKNSSNNFVIQKVNALEWRDKKLG